MSERDWFADYERQAAAAGDGPRVRLARLHREAYRYRETEPDRVLALLAEGRRAAEALGEPWWVLYYDQQRVHALLHFKQDYRDVLDLAVRNTLEVRKSAYAGYPRQWCVHGDLVGAYLGIDPVGHAPAIREALDYLEAAVPPDGDDRYLLLGNRRQLALELGRIDDAEVAGRDSLALAAADAEAGRARHFLVFAYAGLCEVAWRRGAAAALAEAAWAGEELARVVGHQMELAGFYLWRALAALEEGESAAAEALFRQGSARLGRLRMPADPAYRDAQCAYLEATGRAEQALALRDEELAAIAGRGRFAYECACHLKRCRLRRRLGGLTAEDLAEARRAAGRLRQPGRPLAELARIESGVGP